MKKLNFIVVRIPKNLILFSFLFANYIHAKSHPGEVYEKYADQIMNSFANELEKKFKLYCCGSGGQMPYDIVELSMGFNSYKAVTLEEARKLEVTITEMLVNKINAHEKIQPFLREQPFTRKSTCIFISFRKKDGSYFPGNNIAYVIHANDYIAYKINDPLTNKYVNIHREPYDEAVRILKENPVAD